MGHRPNAYMGYGIAYDDSDLCEIDDLDVWEVMGALENHPTIQAEIWAHEETQGLLLYVGESFHRNDWDYVTDVDLTKLKEYPDLDESFKDICAKFGLTYVKPKLVMVSYYG